MIEFQADANFDPSSLGQLPQIFSEVAEGVEEELRQIFLTNLQDQLEEAARRGSGHFPVDNQNYFDEEELLLHLSEGMYWDQSQGGSYELRLESDLFEDEEQVQDVLFNLEYGDPWLDISPRHVLSNAWRETRSQAEEVLQKHQDILNQRLADL